VPVIHTHSDSDSWLMMRQRTEDVGYVEKQIKRFESEDCIAKDEGPPSPNIPPFMRSFSTSAAADVSTYNNVSMDVLDIKTMLLKVKRLLEQQDVPVDVPSCKCGHNPVEVAQLRSVVASLQVQLNEKDQKIRQLEEEIRNKAKDAATQLSGPNTQKTVHRPHSLHNLSSASSRPCHHVWGPCAADHSHHHGRSGGETHQSRASSTSRTSGRSSSPWGYSSSGSSGSSPVIKKIRNVKEVKRDSNYKRSANTVSRMLPSSPPVYKSSVSSDTGRHKLCISVNQNL